MAVNCLHLHNYASEMAPGNTVGEGLIGWYIAVTQTPGLDQTHQINVLGFGVGTMVDG